MPGVRLDCLGSGHAFSHGRYWNGFLLDGRVLVDCPPQTLAHLYKLGVPSAAVDLLLLSHEHSDHIGGVDLFLLDTLEGPKYGASQPRTRPLAIAGPPGVYERLREVLGEGRLPARDDERVRWLEQRDGTSFEWAGLTVECIEMEHAPELTALGYRVHAPGALVAYTGDTRLCDAVYRLAEGADVLIVECAGARAAGHFEWDDIHTLRAALPERTRILVTHYVEPSTPAYAEGVTLVEDLARYEL